MMRSMVGGTERPAIPSKRADPGGTRRQTDSTAPGAGRRRAWCQQPPVYHGDQVPQPSQPRRQRMPDKKPEKKKKSNKKPKKQQPAVPADVAVPGKQKKS